MATKVGGYGPERARIMIVGEAPGAQEELQGRPFVGPAGQLLRDFLQEVGIDPEEVYFTNLCKYRPPGNKLEAFYFDGGIPNSLVTEGLFELEEEIARISPNIILACGNFPMHELLGKGEWIDKYDSKTEKRIRGFTGIRDWRGSLLPSTLGPRVKTLSTYHPSYILQEGMKDHGTFKTDLARLKEQSFFPAIPRLDKTIVLVDKTPLKLLHVEEVDGVYRTEWEPYGENRAQVEEHLRCDPSAVLTLDIEYIGSKLLCCGVTTDRDHAFVIPTPSLQDIQYAQRIILGAGRGINAQNAMFDAAILEWHYNMKVMPRVVYDTMVAAHAANMELPKALEYLTSIYTYQPYYKGMVNWNLIKAGKQPLDVVYAYNGLDVWTQHEIMEEQLRWDLTNEGVRSTFLFMMRLLQPLWDMSKRGIKIDLALMKYVKEELQAEAALQSLELMFLADHDQLLNVKSGPQMSHLLYKQLGLPVIKMNKTGPATDDKTLAQLQIQATTEDQRKAITYIRQIRTARDLQSKFFDIGFDDDGRMRGHYDPTKTVTGRLASRKFFPTGKGTNQQNIPRDKRARRAFIADTRKVFLYADLEKAESLVVAHLTGDPKMLRDHSPGQNAHKNLGSDLFNVSPEDIDEDQYYLAKKTRHAGNYMQGWITFMRNVNQDSEKTGVSLDGTQAKFFINRYRDLHPGLKQWWDRVKDTLYKGRTLYNLLGRHRTFYGHIHSILPEAVAFTPQSTVGDVLDIGLLTLSGIPSPYLEQREEWHSVSFIHEALQDCGFELLQQIHDAVGFQVWEKDLERAVPLVREAMRVPLVNPRTGETFIIPVEVLADVDPEHLRVSKSNWGDCKVYTADLVTHG